MEGNLNQDEDSQGSVSKREVRRFRCEVIVPESTEVFTAEKVVEYVWPLEGCGEHYFIQEQISQYLGIMSFKRKYPDLRRRPLEMQERDYLKEKGLVSEMACDLGLTAVRSEDVLDVMLVDFPSKFEELQKLLRERKENEMKERGKGKSSQSVLYTSI
ncbi:PHD finger protein 10 [Halocaridina rubra]|uniref:PHD finger protein 10 n=1 Tax=Halocaridina rubra TaxID=373956 RepID=A0AAN8ZNQ3_HALRR